MGRPRKYEDPYGGQKAYFKTLKGKAARQKYQTSDKGKEVKRNWWRENYGKIPLDPVADFIQKYGDPDTALNLLPQKQKLVIKYLYGLDGGEPLTQEAISNLMGCSQQWIAELKKRAIAKLEKVTKSKHEAIDPQQEKKPLSK
ncbi:MAG: sigma factor-like helix-turn-helix DNA-binding protein [Prochloraceae cyanobacterium]